MVHSYVAGGGLTQLLVTLAPRSPLPKAHLSKAAPGGGISPSLLLWARTSLGYSLLPMSSSGKPCPLDYFGVAVVAISPGKDAHMPLQDESCSPERR